MSPSKPRTRDAVPGDQVNRPGWIVQGTEPDDWELMRRFQDRGDDVAFESLFRRHREGLYQFLLRLSRSPTVAEEVSQQTWLKLVELAGQGRYRAAAPFRTALFSMARNRFLDEHVRRHEATRSIPIDDPDVGELPDGGADIGVFLERLESQAAVEQALGALPRAQAEVVALWMQGFELVEVARITGAPWHTVVSRKRYALEKLRRALAPGDEGG